MRSLLVRLFRRVHRHDWVRVGYGGAGWFVYECRTCPRWDIG